MGNHPESMTRARFVSTLASAAWTLGAAPATAAKPPAPAQTKKDKSGRTMILIPAGLAVLGTPEREVRRLAAKYGFHPSWLAAENPRRVPTKAFWIDEFPVTNADFVRFCRATGHSWALLRNVEAALDEAGRLPVAVVTLSDANAFAQWLGKRLPNQIEWEYAARGPKGLVYPWGNEWDPARCNSNDKNVPNGRDLTPVDAYPKGASPFGVKDLVGNLCEWTCTPYGTSHVVKGGFWKQHQPYRFRAACRLMTQWGINAQDYIGFRCAEDVPDDDS